MARKFVDVPKDMRDIKEQIFLGLTKKQIVGFGSALVLGIPIFITTRTVIGNDLALFLTMGVMFIPILLTLYKPATGNTLKEYIKVYLKYHFISYGMRVYEAENYFSSCVGTEIERRNREREKQKQCNAIKHKARKRQEKNSEKKAH